MKKSRKRSMRLSGAAAIAGGLALAGASLAGMLLAGPAQEARADEGKRGVVNYVRSVNHDAISGVRLDEELVISFNAHVFPASVGPDTILVRTGTNNGEQARAQYVVGRFMYDRRASRRVVIRPEAVQEYFQLVKDNDRATAARKAERFIRRIEKSGRFKRLRKIDRGLEDYFGVSANIRSRLDDDTPNAETVGVYPVLSTPDHPLNRYRTLIAGDDELWLQHLNDDANAFPELARNPNWERFYHPVDPATGAQAASSVLRGRQYRQVLINRRPKARVMVVPNIPIRQDLSDTGFQPGSAYSITIPTGQPGVFNTVLTKVGRRLLRQRGGRDFGTLFTTIPNTGANRIFADPESQIGILSSQKPRVINTTPPNGETAIDLTTDWEDPDNFTTPVQARRTFTVRLRFAQPLDPRTVNPTTFLLFKTAQFDSPGDTSPTPFDLPVPIGTFLNQTRLGIVEVELTPAQDLDPLSQYEIVISPTVRSLAGEFLGSEFRQSFRIGEGEPPLTRIYETFLDQTNQASAADPLTSGQVTTARWAAPALYDPERTGRLVANFMPFLGDGQGAPADPSNPVPFDPNNPDTFPVTDLVLGTGEEITFVTEGIDPTDPQTFGEQIEYNYRSFTMDTASAFAVGRFPLVIRSQTSIIVKASLISVAGQDGQAGIENADPFTGVPTGGRGGAAGPGGYRGGNGAFVALVDADNNLILDAGNNPQIDGLATDGQDGQPSYLVSGPMTGGAGSGGFSGRREEGATIDIDPPANNGTEPNASPERISESGGGGGHATVGERGDAGGATTQMHPGGYNGGLGGFAYGAADMGDQPLNADGIPVLGAGAGGAGGGGGGGEMEPDPNDNTDIDSVGPEDSGGGGGGGGGGGLHMVARTLLQIDGSIVDCGGGDGGRSFDANLANFGQGAGGGGGAGGAFWGQCYGDIEIVNGSTLNVGGGAGGRGEVSPDSQDDPPGSSGNLLGDGGDGGLGYIRLEDEDGSALIAIPVDQFVGVLSQDVFRPATDVPNGVSAGSYPSHKLTDLPSTGAGVLGVPMVENVSEGYMNWVNTQLDTPTLVPVFNDPNGDPTFGTKFEEPGNSTVEIFVRAASNDVNAPGNPDADAATPWTPLVDAENVSDRRFVQARFIFTVPFDFDFDLTELPYVDILHVEIELK